MTPMQKLNAIIESLAKADRVTINAMKSFKAKLDQEYSDNHISRIQFNNRWKRYYDEYLTEREKMGQKRLKFLYIRKKARQ